MIYKLNEKHKFIIEDLDDNHLFVDANYVEHIKTEVEKLLEEIPYYTRRLKVRPGITGLYQAMVDKYDENIDDVKERVRYDLMYIESMSFRLDMKILFRTAYMMFRGKGQA